MDSAVVGAVAALLGSAVGGASTIYVARQSLPAQSRQAEVATQTLLLHQDAQARAEKQRWDEERHRTYADFMATVSRHRRSLMRLFEDNAGLTEASPIAREVNSDISAKYNSVRLLASPPVAAAAKELLIDVDWYVRAIEGRDAADVAPEAGEVARIVEKYEHDAPLFVAAVQSELGLAH